MANRFKGEVEFEAGDHKYKLSFSANALCELEDVLGSELNAVIESMKAGKMKLGDTRKIFWVGLLDHQPETTIEDAKKILSKVSPAQMSQLIGDAFTRAMEDITDPAATEPRPQQPAPETPAPAPGAGPAS